jgi:hypothetical protein
MRRNNTERTNDVVATLPGKRTVRMVLHWREIRLTDGRVVTVCEHRPVQPKAATSAPAI